MSYRADIEEAKQIVVAAIELADHVEIMGFRDLAREMMANRIAKDLANRSGGGLRAFGPDDQFLDSMLAAEDEDPFSQERLGLNPAQWYTIESDWADEVMPGIFRITVSFAGHRLYCFFVRRMQCEK